MAAEPVRTRPSSTTRFRLVGKDDLLTDILGATESEAAHQAREIERELQQREEAARLAEQAEEKARRQSVMDALRLEEERRERARVKRQLVLKDIEEEEKRITGEYTIERDVRPVAPDTAQLAAAARAAEAPAPDYWARADSASLPAATSRRLWPIVAVPAALVAGLLAFALLGGGPEIDPAAYPKASLSVAAHGSPAAALAMTEAEEQPRSRRRAESDDAHERRRSQRADDDPAQAEAEDDHRRPLSISLDNAEDLWERGSD